MDPRDLPPMRSGLGPPGARQHAVETAAATRVRARLIASATVLVTRAVRVAATVCSHAGRTEITGADQSAALKFAARHFFDDDDDGDLEREIADVAAAIEGMTSSDDDDDDGSDDSMPSLISDDADDADIPTPAAVAGVDPAAPCGCEVCLGVIEAAATWTAWAPTDEAEVYLKNAVESAEAKAMHADAPGAASM